MDKPSFRPNSICPIEKHSSKKVCTDLIKEIDYRIISRQEQLKDKRYGKLKRANIEGQLAAFRLLSGMLIGYMESEVEE